MIADDVPMDTADSLPKRIAATLAPLGGRAAFAARRFGGAPGRMASPASPAGDDPGGILLRADDVLPAGRLAALPVAVELLRRIDLGHFDLAERFDADATPRAPDPATRPTLGDLCALMLTAGDDAAANFLLGLVGRGEVNESMSRLNLAHTRLGRRATGPAARAAHREDLTSAGDMLALLALIRGGALPGARWLREALAARQSFTEIEEAWMPSDAELAHIGGARGDTVHGAGLLAGPGGACAYCVLTAGRRDLPAARAAIGRIVRLLWGAWCTA